MDYRTVEPDAARHSSLSFRSRTGAAVASRYDNATSTSAKLGGDIVVTVGNNLSMSGGQGIHSFAQIGHGGNGSGPNYAASGSIALNTSGLFQMNSGFGAEAYTLVGHGGFGSGGTANYGLAGESIAVTARAVVALRRPAHPRSALLRVTPTGVDVGASSAVRT